MADYISRYETGAAVDAALDLAMSALQPETGKGLSTNDYSTGEKTKLAGIAEGAEVNEIEGIKVNNTTINPDANKVVNITVPTTAADVSALPDTTKYATALSLTINSSTFVMTGQLKDQNGDNLGTAQTIDLPLESVVVGGSYNSQTKKVVLTLQNGNTIEFSVADLVLGLQTEFSASNKLNPSYIDYDITHAAVTEAQRDQIETNKNNILSIQEDVAKISGQGVEIAVNSDLNEFNDVGTYYSGGASTSSTLSNCPTIQPFRLYVDFWQSSSNRIQRIVAVKDTSNFEPIIFYRVKTLTGWKSWIKFEGSAVT